MKACQELEVRAEAKRQRKALADTLLDLMDDNQWSFSDVLYALTDVARGCIHELEMMDEDARDFNAMMILVHRAAMLGERLEE
jgi:hypothetical protein